MTSVAQTATPAPPPHTFMDVLLSWGNTWLWDNISIVGVHGWINDAISDGSLLAVTDGSFIREQYPTLCSAAFVLECTKGRGRMVGSFRIIKGSERVSRGVARPDGHPPHPAECRHSARRQQWERRGGVRLSRRITTGDGPPALSDPFPLQALRHPQEHLGSLSQPILHDTLPACQGASRRWDVV